MFQLFANKSPFVFIQLCQQNLSIGRWTNRSLAVADVKDMPETLDVSHCKLLTVFRLDLTHLKVPAMSSFQPWFFPTCQVRVVIDFMSARSLPPPLLSSPLVLSS